MHFYIAFLFSVIVFSFVNAAIIVQAPKYVPKHELQNLVRTYYQQLQNGRRLNRNKGIEIEVPIPLSRSQQYKRRIRNPAEARMSKRGKKRYTVTITTTTTQPPTTTPVQVMPIQQLFMRPVYSSSDIQYAMASENLRRAEEAVRRQLRRSENEAEASKNGGQPSSGSSPRREIYQEDVQKALDELEARLKAGGNRPATLEDLMKLVDELEKKILEKQKDMATSTPNPCGEERILQEALQPVMQDDLWGMMRLAEKCSGDINMGLGQAMGALGNTDEETRRAVELILRQPSVREATSSNSHENILSETRRSIGHELIDLLEDKNESTILESNSSRRSVREQLVDLLKYGVAVEENPRALEDKGLIPIKIEIPKSFKDIIIKT